MYIQSIRLLGIIYLRNGSVRRSFVTWGSGSSMYSSHDLQGYGPERL